MRPVALFCQAFFTTAVPAAAFPAHILYCHGDETCCTVTGQGSIRVRVSEIDSAEIDQPYGTQARDVMCAMVCDKDVDVEPRGRSYDRVVGLIEVGGLDTSGAMVAAGAAWDYAQYDRDLMMPVLQEKARARRLGLWAEPAPVAPWTWRHSRAGRFTPPR